MICLTLTGFPDHFCFDPYLAIVEPFDLPVLLADLNHYSTEIDFPGRFDFDFCLTIDHFDPLAEINHCRIAIGFPGYFVLDFCLTIVDLHDHFGLLAEMNPHLIVIGFPDHF